MNFELSPAQRDMRDGARRMIERELMPVVGSKGGERFSKNCLGEIL